ncbi:acylneuraminate cytidylyltransferase family protein [Synechococcus sp. AH-551-N23]|nr:acylneuraminate cytidylyltransferase family protein [Synechococcus sp. AH-551-N23]
MINIIGLILARGGSKRLPSKNLIDLGGRPLIAWSIDAAYKSNMISAVYVSSDSESILNTSLDHGALAHKRAPIFATDQCSSEDSIYEFFASNPSLTETFTYACLLQPTSPFRTHIHIDEAIGLMIAEGGNSCISVYQPSIRFDKYLHLDESGHIVSYNSNFSENLNLYPNGAVYAFNIALFMQTRSIMNPKCVPYLMSGSSNLDIDNKIDLDFARFLIST